MLWDQPGMSSSTVWDTKDVRSVKARRSPQRGSACAELGVEEETIHSGCRGKEGNARLRTVCARQADKAWIMWGTGTTVGCE